MIQIETITAQLAEKEAALASNKAHLAELHLQHDNAKAGIFETQEQLEKLRAQLADETRILDAKKNEYDLLKSLVDSMEGYPDSVKFYIKIQGGIIVHPFYPTFYMLRKNIAQPLKMY